MVLNGELRMASQVQLNIFTYWTAEQKISFFLTPLRFTSVRRKSIQKNNTEMSTSENSNEISQPLLRHLESCNRIQKKENKVCMAMICSDKNISDFRSSILQKRAVCP